MLNYMAVLLLGFLRNLHTNSYHGYRNFHSLKECSKVPFSPHPPQNMFLEHCHSDSIMVCLIVIQSLRKDAYMNLWAVFNKKKICFFSRFSRGKNSLFYSMVLRQMKIQMQKIKLHRYLISYTKVDLKQTKDLRISAKAIKLIEEITGVNNLHLALAMK